MLSRPERYSSKLFFTLLILVSLFAATGQAQIKKTTKSKQTATKTAEKSVKDARKDSKAKNEPKSSKSTDKNSKNSKKAREESARLAEAKRAEEAKRRAAEEARRQAILAEKRRREQAAREARERALAFERGLRTTTIENISNDNTEGEDWQIRRAAINALGNHAGTVVVMEAQTGKILTIVNQDWAIRNSYRPCSTIKLVTGIAGLNENIIGEDGSIGNFRMNLDDALAFSNNVYFQRVGVSIGNDRIIEYARALGLGEPTGINDQSETGGKLPYNNNNARIYSHGDDFEVSPVQLAVMVSAISNGGKIVVPQVPRTRLEQTNFRGYLRRRINLPMNKVTGVIPGMVGAAEYGTAHRGVDSSLGIAGKTGSCIGKGSWLGLFASVAPVQNPKYAVVVITRGQAERGKYAAAVAGKIYQALTPRLFENGNRNLALIPYNLKPKTQINLKTASNIKNEDEDENTDEEIVADTEKEKIVVAPKTPERKVEKVEKSEKVENAFPPVIIKVKKADGELTRPRIVNNK